MLGRKSSAKPEYKVLRFKWVFDELEEPNFVEPVSLQATELSNLGGREKETLSFLIT